MNEQAGKEVEEETPKKPRRWRTDLMFTVAVLAAAGAGLLWVATLTIDEWDYDHQNVFTIGIISGAVLVLGLWFLIRASIRRLWKVLIPVGTLALLVGSLRIENATGDMHIQLAWRWSPRPDQLLDKAEPQTTVTAPAEAAPTGRDYPRFLGADGRAAVRGLPLETDWKNHPPKQLWRQPIGAGWSAFAVVGPYAVTQEQRDEEELVVCYELTSGKILWSHADLVRFIDLVGVGGVGPRATPTIHEGKVYTQGATGILNCLELSTGQLHWSRNIIEENQAPQIEWGRSGSPLVVDHMVVVSAGGPNNRSLVAYDRETGERIWSAGSDRASYASPIVATLDDVWQVVTVNEDHVRGHRLDDGEPLWDFDWPGSSSSDANTSQPVALDSNRVFISKGYQDGCAVFDVRRDANGRFRAELIWRAPTLLKTKMTNVVIHDGHLYGLSGGILECVQIDQLKQRWKGGRYGHGQIMLVDDYLLVVTEKGAVAIAEATPKEHVELARFQALKGKTWNNPAIAGPYLLVRNHLEAACYELPLTDSRNEERP
jgi:outer membrane protein assembly factor BamB